MLWQYVFNVYDLTKHSHTTGESFAMGDTVKIDFGKVERYVKDRGFGFISHTFAGSPSREVFFHIKNVRRTHPELAQALNTYNSHEPLYFWYEFETSEKGQQVRTILDPEKIGQNYSDNMFALKQTIGASWANADISISETTKKATFDLFPPNEARQLEARRKNLEEEKKISREDQTTVKKAENEEFCQLVAELATQGFTQSSQVSAYIIRNSLSNTYKHISGILQMRIGTDVWNFNGGFPPKIYARLCEELGLENQGSRAKPLSFTAYRDIKD